MTHHTQKNPIEQVEHDVEVAVKRRIKLIRKFKKANEDRLLFAAFVVIISAVVVVNTIYVINRLPAKSASSSRSNTAMNPNTILSSSLTASTGAFDVRLTNVHEDATPDKAFAFPQDYTMLRFAVMITNTTSSTQQLIPASQLYVRSKSGDVYMTHASSKFKNALAFQELAAGQSASGEVGFAIPKTLTDPLFYVDLGWDKHAPVVYDVLK